MNLIFKKIIRVIITVLAFMVPIAVFSQKLEKPVIDKFSNDTTYSTSQTKIASNGKNSSAVAEYLFADVVKRHNAFQLNLELYLTLEGHKYFVVNEGKKVFLKLSDNSMITLTSLKGVEATAKTTKMGVVIREFETADATYAIAKDDIQKILTSSVTAIRFETDYSSFDFDIVPKDDETLRKMFSLIISAK